MTRRRGGAEEEAENTVEKIQIRERGVSGEQEEASELRSDWQGTQRVPRMPHQGKKMDRRTQRVPRPVLRAFQEFDFEELGPALAGDEKAIVLGVVGDAVEDIGLRVAIGGSQETAAVDPADDFAGFGVDAGDAFGLPDVGIDFALDPFELV